MRDLIAGEVLNILRSDETDARVTETSPGGEVARGGGEVEGLKRDGVKREGSRGDGRTGGQEAGRSSREGLNGLGSSVSGLNPRVAISDEEDAPG